MESKVLLINGVETAICPFDPSHHVLRKRLQYHILKCRVNYKGAKVPCPYNATEYFLQEDMAQHLSTCKSKELNDEQMMRKAPVNSRKLNEAPYFNQHAAQEEDDEMWN